MKKTAVVFWSGTGNTESMANAVLEGMKAAGAEAELFTSEQADAAKLALFDAIAFGCPAMGAEELEETEFAPMFDAVKALFPARTPPCSALMAGATANGCAPGRTTAGQTA